MFGWEAVIRFSSADFRHIIQSIRCQHDNCPSSAAKPCWLPGNAAAQLPFGIDVLGYLRSEIGLGEAARLLVQALDAGEVPTNLINIPLPGRMSETALDERLVDSTRHGVALSVFGVDSLRAMSRRSCRTQKNIAYLFWELSTMPRQWRSALNGFDAYWAPSVFIRDMLVSQTRRPVALIPQPVFLPAAPAAPQKFSGPLKCFSFFDFDSFSSRKNPFGAIRAFLTAFPNGHEEARLIIKCRGGQTQSRQELYSLAQKDPRIEILDRLISREEMNALMEDCHVFLSLHRSEGFGLGCAEALARGKIVVATDYGGTRDFVSEATGYPVAYTLKELGLKDYPGARGAHWAEPNVEHAASILKDIYFNPERAQEKPLRGFQYLRDNHSFKVVGEKMRQAILSS